MRLIIWSFSTQKSSRENRQKKGAVKYTTNYDCGRSAVWMATGNPKNGIVQYHHQPSDGVSRIAKQRIRHLMTGCAEWTQEALIAKLNPIITGWTNYHQSVCVGDTFSAVDHTIFELLWRWAHRRHPNKPQWWKVRKYWHSKETRRWVFCTERIELKAAEHTPIVRHVKIRANANPYLEPEYFEKRKFQSGMRRLSGKFKAVWRKQRGVCPVCNRTIDLTEERKIHFRVPRSQGGTDTVDNMVYVHKDCEKHFRRCCATA